MATDWGLFSPVTMGARALPVASLGKARASWAGAVGVRASNAGASQRATGVERGIGISLGEVGASDGPGSVYGSAPRSHSRARRGLQHRPPPAGQRRKGRLI